MMPDDAPVSIEQIAADFGVAGVDCELLQTALTHTTAANLLGVPSFQRLEYLGDAVLEICVTRALFDMFPDAQEGALTQMRAGFVRRVSLAAAARALHLERYIRVAKAEKYAVEPDNPKVMADSLEAVIAAVYLSLGLDAADSFIRRIFLGFENAERYALYPETPGDAFGEGGAYVGSWKSALEMFMKQEGIIDKELPEYAVVNRRGPAHKPEFCAVCSLHGKILGSGSAQSKKKAEQAAARAAYLALARAAKQGATIIDTKDKSDDKEMQTLA